MVVSQATSMPRQKEAWFRIQPNLQPCCKECMDAPGAPRYMQSSNVPVPDETPAFLVDSSTSTLIHVYNHVIQDQLALLCCAGKSKDQLAWPP